MATEKEIELIAPCGLYCTNCAYFVARTDENLRSKIAERQSIAVEEVPVCAGCRPMRGRVKAAGGEPICETYACAIDDKKVVYCYECDEFPCLKLAPAADRAVEIPHNAKIYQLLMLQKMGADDWIEGYYGLLRQYQRGKKPKSGGDIQR